MSTPTLEQRVAELESQVTQMLGELRSTKERAGKDWRRTIGAFTDDEGVKELLQEAMRLREEDRKNVKSKNNSS
jgi:predicted  nucleic acid-binding Zn-ribbon protein